jgi:DNA-binding NarL/FixJ family response regulator
LLLQRVYLVNVNSALLQFAAEEFNKPVWNHIQSLAGEPKFSLGDSHAAPPRNLRFVIADSDPTIRKLVKTIVEEQGSYVVGVASNGDKAVQLCRDLRPDMAVLDLSMPRLNGIDASHEIKEGCPDTKIILLVAHPDGPCIFQSLCAGAAGYVTKDQAASSLPEAIAAVFRGEIYVRASGSRRCLNSFLAAAEGRITCEAATAASMCLEAFLAGARGPGTIRERDWERKAIRPGFRRRRSNRSWLQEIPKHDPKLLANLV